MGPIISAIALVTAPEIVVATSEEGDQSSRTPLRSVVAECEGRWFAATEKAAMNGDVFSQSLVGQMLLSGYGTPQDAVQGVFWLQKASEKDDDAKKLLNSLVPGSVESSWRGPMEREER